MFNFKTRPYAHQLKALEESWAADYFGLFMEMGTGKSKVALDTISTLYKERRVNAALIVAPKGVYSNWVEGEIPTHLPDYIPIQMSRWRPAQSKSFAEEMKILISDPFDGLKIFVVNVEAFSTPRGTKAAVAFLSKNPENIMIVDESTTIKNRKALRTKNIMKCGDLTKYRRILTGSPITKSPMDLFSQAQFLSPQALNFKSYYSFQNRYANIVRRTMGARQFQEIVSYKRLDELNEKLERFSYRVLKDECLDLPNKIYLKRNVELTDEQARVYKQMKKLALAQLDTGELATTQSVLTQIMRLQQICCGFFQPDDGEIEELPSKRMDALLDVTEEVQGKVIIWASWTHDIRKITKALEERFGSEAVAAYFGETKQDERQDIVNRFQDKDDPLRFFVGQPRTGGFGLTLTAANTVIYYSNQYDLEIRLQSEDRAHRIGQHNAVTYVDLIAPKTVDEQVIKALKQKMVLSGAVLNEEVRKWLT